MQRFNETWYFSEILLKGIDLQSWEFKSDSTRHITSLTNIIWTWFNTVDVLPLYAQTQLLHLENRFVIWSLVKTITCIGRLYRVLLCARRVEDNKGVIGIRKSKDRQHNDDKKKDKKRSTKHTHTTKDRVTRTQLTNPGMNSGALVW